MKQLKKKLKKINIIKRLFYYLTIIIYLVTYSMFTYNLLNIKIETTIRIIILIIFGIWFFIYLLQGLVSLLSKTKKTFIIITIISLLISPLFIVSSYYMNVFYSSIKQMNKKTIIYRSNLIALKNTNFTSSSIIGMVDAENDTEGITLAQKLIKKENLTNQIEIYNDYQTMILAMYDGKIDACFVSGNYFVIDTESIGNVDLEKDTKVLFTYEEELKNEDSEELLSSRDKKLTEPFTVLIMGVDSEINGLKANQAFNGDTLILVTFNPKTLTATMFSIPRDLYVPIACNHNRYAKINSSAAYGSSCVINTIKKLTSIDIDYYVKINFTGVVNLIDALGGVEVEVEKPDFTYNENINCNGKICEQNSLRQFGKNIVYITPGLQNLNGEQALAYARNRHQYALSDIARNQHQQAIIEAVAKKAKTIRNVSSFKKILDTVSHNTETNMTPEQIMSFYYVGKDMLLHSNTSSLSIKKTYITYYNLNVWRGYYSSALGYYEESLNAIKNLMLINLEKKENKPIKTFKISANEEYETPLVGYGLTGGTRLQTMPNFIGYDKNYVNEWCNNNGISCSFLSETSGIETNQIIYQSLHDAELLVEINRIEFHFSDGNGQTIPNNNNQEQNENNEENEEENEEEEKKNEKPNILNPENILNP